MMRPDVPTSQTSLFLQGKQNLLQKHLQEVPGKSSHPGSHAASLPLFTFNRDWFKDSYAQCGMREEPGETGAPRTTSRWSRCLSLPASYRHFL